MGWNILYPFHSYFTDPQELIGQQTIQPNVATSSVSTSASSISVTTPTITLSSYTPVARVEITPADSSISNLLKERFSFFYKQSSEVSTKITEYVADITWRFFTFLRGSYSSSENSSNQRSLVENNMTKIKISVSGLSILVFLLVLFRKWTRKNNEQDENKINVKQYNIFYRTARSARRKLREFFRRWPEFKIIEVPFRKINFDTYNIDITNIEGKLTSIFIFNLACTTVLSDDETTIRIYIQQNVDDIPEDIKYIIKQEKTFLFDLRRYNIQNIEVLNVLDGEWENIYNHIFLIQSDIIDPDKDIEKPLQAFLTVSSRVKKLFYHYQVEKELNKQDKNKNSKKTFQSNSKNLNIPNITINILKEDIARNIITPQSRQNLDDDSSSENNGTESLSTITIDSLNHEKMGFDLYKEKFEEINVSNDGEVNIEELRDFFASHGYFFTRQDLLDFLSEFDKDNSGSINFEEFMNAMKAIEEESLTGSFITDTESRY